VAHAGKARELTAALLSRCRFPERPTLVCAVSGGADSAALLVLAATAGYAVVEAVHVDHGLRPDSAGEREQVRQLAQRVGARFRSVKVDVGPGSNLEARAREARYAALPADVATGHTMDDLAETVLLNLLRGAATDGLSPLVSGPRVRPLLGLRRAETAQLCAAHGYVPVVDEMNADPAFRRVRVRHELLPLLSDVAERDVVPVLARQASLLHDELQYLSAQAELLDPTDARALGSAPVALARRAVRLWLAREGVGNGHPPPAAAIERVLALAAGRGSRADLFGGWSVARRDQRLRLIPPGAAPNPPR